MASSLERFGDTVILVPAFNEEAALPTVLREIREKLGEIAVVVIDDGSSDSTSAVARQAGVEVLDLPFNMGVGGAMRAGFRYAVESGFHTAVQVDADGQHDPALVPLLLAKVRSGADIVIGARFAGEGDYRVRGPRRWAMIVLARSLSKICRQPLRDVTSGFRASSGPALRLFADEFPAEYLGDTIESLVLAARAGLRIEQVPVAMRARSHGMPSQSPIRAAIHLTRASFVIALAMIRRRPVVPPPRAAGYPAAEGASWRI